MTFRLYSDATCSTQVGGNIVESDVPVTDGLFSVEVAVTHSDFNGQGLWLEVEVGGTQIGCQEILPVPYALSLRPGAQVTGEQTDGNAIYAYNKATTGGTTYGVHGRSDSSDGAAIYGSGDVKQNRTGNGLVKAAVHTYCGICVSVIPQGYFNNVNANPIGVKCGSIIEPGHCTIDFGFDINDRFWAATAVDAGGDDEGVSCELGSSSNLLGCDHWDATNGNLTDGYIMVLLY